MDPYTPHAVALQTYLDRVVMRYHPRKVVMFGSCAEGTASEDSDIDLAIFADFADIAEDRIFDELYDLARDVNQTVFIHAYGLTPRLEKERADWTLLRSVNTNGKVLYQK